MKFRSAILLLLISLYACQDVKRMEEPDDLIPKDKMVDVLVEVSLVQGAKSASKSMFEKTGIKPYEYLWDRFDIDSLQFVESNNYYAENYEEYEDIYRQVEERLEILRVKYDSIKQEQELIRDSIRGVDPEDSLARVREEAFRDSILRISKGEERRMPEPVSKGDSID